MKDWLDDVQYPRALLDIPSTYPGLVHPASDHCSSIGLHSFESQLYIGQLGVRSSLRGEVRLFALALVQSTLTSIFRYSEAGGFFLAFVYFYLGMAALGLALEAMITLLTPVFTPFFLFTLVSVFSGFSVSGGVNHRIGRLQRRTGAATVRAAKPIFFIWYRVPNFVSLATLSSLPSSQLNPPLLLSVICRSWYFIPLIFRNKFSQPPP